VTGPYLVGFSRPQSTSETEPGVRWLWRCRSLKRFHFCARSRNASGRNSCGESRAAQGIRNWALLCRGIGRFSSPLRSANVSSPSNRSHSTNSSGNGQPRLRDQLCVLIRQHKLDPNLVKAYAADFCGTAALSGASHEVVASFISHLSAAAKENRDALVCKLNSFAQPVEANS